jgi:hypothetical protein
LIRFLTDASREELPIHSIVRLLVAAYLVEAGLLLIIAPWTQFWDRNYFAGVVGWLGAAMSSAFVRGAVSGVGVVTLVAGIRDLVSVIGARRASVGPTPDGPAPGS